MAGKTCGTIGCKAPATHVLTYSFPESRDTTETDLVCLACAAGYQRRPTLKATFLPIPVVEWMAKNS